MLGALVAVAPAALAAGPSVVGVVGPLAEGKSITLSGSGFGSKSHAAPLLWDNFEGGTNGHLYSDPQYGHPEKWTTQVECTYGIGGYHSQEYTNARSYGQGHLSGLQYLATEAPCWARTKIGVVGQQTHLYFSYRYYLVPQGGNHLKMGRIGCDDDVHCWPDVGMTAEGPSYYYHFADGTTEHSDIGIDPLENQWARDAYWAVISSPGGNDGTVGFWRNGVQLYFSAAANTRNAGVHGYYDQVFLPYYSEAGPNTLYIDDVYIDDTLSRVELCAGSTWAAKGNCEIQIPSGWQASSVTVTVNQGNFAAGGRAYLYVIDSTGTANSSGLGITIGTTYGASDNPSDVPNLRRTDTHP